LLTGLPKAGLLCELVAPEPNPTGRMAQLADCIAFATEHKLELITVEMIKEYREKKGL
jgi:3,4-dihydroxy-2-butanone 4-phosphate synthase